MNIKKQRGHNMDKRTRRKRMLARQRQMRRRRQMRLGIGVAAVVLALIVIVKGIIPSIVGNIGVESKEFVQAQASENSEEALRQSLRGQGDLGKVVSLTPGWHEDETGKWYRNVDGTFYISGFKKIDGITYCFDDDGYVQTGWITRGANEYYFNSDGSYNPNKRRPMLALTFDDGPGKYTDTLLQCLEENNAHATFFMLGSCVELYPDSVKKMVEIGCEIGSHSWDHPQLTSIGIDQVAQQFSETDRVLIEACGQAATVARAPYGAANQNIFATVGKPFFMWSMDTLDWSLLNASAVYDSVLNGDLTDGSIILMHDIHETSVQAALDIIPALIEQGYRLVTLSELADAKGVDLQNAEYTDFWDSSLAAGIVSGYRGADWEKERNNVFSDDSTSTSTQEAGSTEGTESAENAEDTAGFADGEGSL